MKNSWTGFTGTGFVWFPSTAGGSANRTVWMSGGLRAFRIRYATASRTESIRLFVNGGLAVSKVPLPGNSPTTWQTATVSVPLVDRKNLVTAVTTGTGGLYMDNFSVY